MCTYGIHFAYENSNKRNCTKVEVRIISFPNLKPKLEFKYIENGQFGFKTLRSSRKPHLFVRLFNEIMST